MLKLSEEHKLFSIIKNTFIHKHITYENIKHVTYKHVYKNKYNSLVTNFFEKINY